MSDDRWSDVEADLDAAVTQLGMALRTFERGGFDSNDPDLAWERSNAFLHGMETGYTLLEKAITRVLDILGETSPSGDAWHKDLIDRVSRPMQGDRGRPAMFDAALRLDLLELMRMRHRARNAVYGDFDASKAGPSVEAASHVLGRIRDAVAQFKNAVDPAGKAEPSGPV
ncbi:MULTISPECIES: hypothetical protein [Bradyrhizobium]|uniref:HepT-like domain-containing protein n=1 Tax=Bradyrhizobium aeschynomenes TaxID=2734909 RepID=A0ABX2CE03_9BRAD|nr:MULTISPECIES: hypothetical protein [Bradyrhizobium]NPU65502.1 hypothetical protein [Bradyrhizobium aeschynomenes]